MVLMMTQALAYLIAMKKTMIMTQAQATVQEVRKK